MSGQDVTLVLCGSLNPLTYMHLRLFEMARDNLQKKGYTVSKGVVSPVDDSTMIMDPSEVISLEHRCRMIEIGLKSTDWIKLHAVESMVHEPTTIIEVLDIIQNDADTDADIMFLCGADVLETFNFSHLWNKRDVEKIVRDFGIAVIPRYGSTNPLETMYRNETLNRYENNIHVVQNFMINGNSSTKLRVAIRRGQSIKYTTPDGIISYIKRKQLYGFH